MSDDDHMAHAEAQDAAGREQIDIHHRSAPEAEARLAWLLWRYQETRGWTEND